MIPITKLGNFKNRDIMRIKASILLISLLTVNCSNAQDKKEKQETSVITTSVVVLTTGPDGVFDKKQTLDYLATLKNKEHQTILKIDSISVDKSVAKLYGYSNNLVIILDKKNMDLLSKELDGSILHKDLGVKGTVIPYGEIFAIQIHNFDQLTIIHPYVKP